LCLTVFYVHILWFYTTQAECLAWNFVTFFTTALQWYVGCGRKPCTHTFVPCPSIIYFDIILSYFLVFCVVLYDILLYYRVSHKHDYFSNYIELLLNFHEVWLTLCTQWQLPTNTILKGNILLALSSAFIFVKYMGGQETQCGTPSYMSSHLFT